MRDRATFRTFAFVAATLTAMAALGACTSAPEQSESEPAATEDAISRSQFIRCKKYKKLSETGLFALDASGKMTSTLAEGVRPFRPAYEMWSDGASKRRWIYLPPGGVIDTRDMDHWRFPKGTKLWKEFSSGTGESATRVETRLIEIGCDADPAHPEKGDGELFVGSFAWNEAGDADFAPDGAAPNVPSQTACAQCHQSEPGGPLGFQAIQLAQSATSDLPLSLEQLTREGRLSNPPTAHYQVPGDATTAAALGYLHANCGHCHTEGGRAFLVTNQQLRLTVADAQKTDPRETSVFRSIVDQRAQTFSDENWLRVKSGDPEKSFLYYRMTTDARRMPPNRLDVDRHGADVVKAWIASLAASPP